MKKLEIIKADKYEYILKDDDNNNYIFNIEFQDVDILPQVGDYIYMSKELLNKNYKEYSNTYTFGSLDSIYGRTINNENNPDIIKIDINNKSFYLKRLYG